jgi:hypothetical protein
LTFSSNISATTSAYAHAVLLFVSGPLEGENSPIVSYNNTNGVFVLEEPLTAAPSDGDEFVVIAGSHVHAIADIQSGLATSAQATAIEADTQDIQGRLPAALVGGRMDSSVGAYQTGLAPPTATENKNAVWNAATVDHTSTGSFGYVVGLFFQLIENVTGWRFTTKALEQVPASSITVSPLAATDIQRVVGTSITVFLKENITIGPIAVTDVNGSNVDLSAPCELIISQKYRGDVIVIADGSITRSGVDNHQFSFSSSGATLIPGTFAWSLRRLSDNYVFAHGDWIVKQTAAKD